MNNASTVFLVIFGSIFLLAGLAMFIGGLSDIGVTDEEAPWVLVVMGAVFATAGGGVIVHGLRMRISWGHEAAVRAAHPDEPWLWTAAWQRRRIEHTAAGSSIGLWFFALFWNAIVVAAGTAGWEELAAQAAEEPAILITLLFPIVGIGLLVAAVRSTLQWRRFGTSALLLEHVPAPVGGQLEGSLQLPNDVRDADELVLVLSCLRTVRSGKSTSTTILWNDEQRHPRAALGSGPHGPTLSVRFTIPADALPTSTGGGYPSIRWKLQAKAAVAGVDFSGEYDVPVFHTSGAARSDGPDDLSITPRPREHRMRGSIQRTVLPERRPDGSVIWDFRPFRAPAAGAFMAAFTVVWTGIVVLIVSADAPGIFALAFGAFDLFLILGTVDVLFGRAVVTIARDGLTARLGPASFWATRRLAINAVKEFRIKPGMNVGSMVFHSVEARTWKGSSVTVGTYLRSLQEAEEIAEEMREEVKRHA